MLLRNLKAFLILCFLSSFDAGHNIMDATNKILISSYTPFKMALVLQISGVW